MAEKILIVEDDSDIRMGMSILLTNQGYCVSQAENGMDALSKYKDMEYDLFIIDIMLPGMNGIELCRQLREKTLAPILFLSAKSAEIDKVEGLGAGGDDYMTKPFSYIELISRVKALLRRYKMYTDKISTKEAGEKRIINVDGVAVNQFKGIVTNNGIEVFLTETEYQILLLLIEHPTKIFSAENIYESVWGEDAMPEAANTVAVHIKNIRNKFRNSDVTCNIIETVWGRGYKFEK